jgi:hypothetical protein
MVDATKYAESRYLTADMVEASPSKKVVILSDGRESKDLDHPEWGERLEFDIEIDMKRKLWRMNRDTVANMLTIGPNTESWVGKVVNVRVYQVSGKKSIIGVPMGR